MLGHAKNDGSAEHHGDQAVLTKKLHIFVGKGLLETPAKFVCDSLPLCVWLPRNGFGGSWESSYVQGNFLSFSEMGRASIWFFCLCGLLLFRKSNGAFFAADE